MKGIYINKNLSKNSTDNYNIDLNLVNNKIDENSIASSIKEQVINKKNINNTVFSILPYDNLKQLFKYHNYIYSILINQAIFYLTIYNTCYINFKVSFNKFIESETININSLKNKNIENNKYNTLVAEIKYGKNKDDNKLLINYNNKTIDANSTLGKESLTENNKALYNSINDKSTLANNRLNVFDNITLNKSFIHIGIIGCGILGCELLKTLIFIKNNNKAKLKITISTRRPNDTAKLFVSNDKDIEFILDNEYVFDNCDVIYICTQSHQFEFICCEIRSCFKTRLDNLLSNNNFNNTLNKDKKYSIKTMPIIVSFMAGVNVNRLKLLLDKRIIAFKVKFDYKLFNSDNLKYKKSIVDNNKNLEDDLEEKSLFCYEYIQDAFSHMSYKANEFYSLLISQSMILVENLLDNYTYLKSLYKLSLDKYSINNANTLVSNCQITSQYDSLSNYCNKMVLSSDIEKATLNDLLIKEYKINNSNTINSNNLYAQNTDIKKTLFNKNATKITTDFNEEAYVFLYNIFVGYNNTINSNKNYNFKNYSDINNHSKLEYD